jgi:L-alanine-DL-glutamate epimerase-like enolase superfamily enzyme
MGDFVENELTWSIDKKVLPLRFNWKISRNSTIEKKNFFIRVTNGTYSGIGEVAPNVRYGETEEITENKFNQFLEQSQQKFTDLNHFEVFLDSLNLTHSLRFGIESAFVHFLCNKKNIMPADFFNLKIPESIETSFSVPILEISEIKNFLEPLKRFKSLKIKVNQETALDMINEVCLHTDQKLRIDGNEAWNDVNSLIDFMEKIKNYNIEFIEQPMPSRFIEEYKYLKVNCDFTLIADESIENIADFNLLKQQFHGINMKLMKAGGYQNGIKILDMARQSGLKTMIGCMVETSLGIYSAINLANNVDYLDLDGFLIIRDDPFDLVKEENGFLAVSKKEL